MEFPSGELSALATALCWGLSPLFTYKAAKAMGVFRFSMARFWISTIGLAFVIPFTQVHYDSAHTLWMLALSGIIGIAIGDLALIKAVSMLGPRRSSIIYTLHAPLTAITGVLIFGELVTITSLIGVTLAFSGVYIATLSRSSKEKSGQEYDNGNLLKGVFICLFAVSCQIIGALVAKASIGSTHALFASFIRTGAATLAFIPAYYIYKESFAYRFKDSAFNASMSAALGAIFGTTFFLIALQNTEVYRAVILASLAPIFYIICMALFTKERFPLGAWIGTVITILGATLTMLSS